jgi:hypothetical protein
MKMRDWIKEADTEAAIGLSEFTGFALRLDKADVKPADDVLRFLVEDGSDVAVLKLVRDEVRLLKRLDEAGIDLVIHEVAKVLRPGIPETEEFLQLPEFDLLLQDHDLNTSLHYLADAGVDLLGAVSFRALLVRNRNGATPLHLMAKHEVFHRRLLALPQSVLDLQTRAGVSVADAIKYTAAQKPTPLQELGGHESKAETPTRPQPLRQPDAQVRPGDVLEDVGAVPGT